MNGLIYVNSSDPATPVDGMVRIDLGGDGERVSLILTRHAATQVSRQLAACVAVLGAASVAEVVPLHAGCHDCHKHPRKAGGGA